MIADRIESWTADIFVPLVGEKFGVSGGSDALPELELELLDAKASNLPEFRGRTPFSLIFQGRADQALAQQVVALHHREIGIAELLIVPIASDANGVRYEVIFS